MKEIIELIQSYWKFDDNQRPVSNWHDKQDLIKAIEALSLPIESDTTNKVSVSEEDAIKFAEWITKNDFELLTRGWVSSLLGYSSTFFTTTELYSIYKEGGSNG